MSFVRRNRHGEGRSIRKTYPVCLITVLLFAAVAATYSRAQSPASLAATVRSTAVKPEPAAPVDPLGRQTPRSSFINFLRYEASGDNATASRFLQLPPGETLEHL